MLKHWMLVVWLLLTSCLMAADVTGVWELTVQTSLGSGSPTLDLNQQGEKLTGTLHSPIFGDVAVKGTVKENRIEFTGQAEVDGTRIKITYKGAIESDKAMKGVASYEGLDDQATWSATKL